MAETAALAEQVGMLEYKSFDIQDLKLKWLRRDQKNLPCVLGFPANRYQTF